MISRTLFTTVFSVLCLMAAAQNTLSVDNLTAAAGKTASVPVYMTNSSDVVAVQFNIELPFDMGSEGVTLEQNRSNGHTISLNKISSKTYTVVVMSLQNKTIKGNSGILLRIPMAVAEEAQADDTYDIKVSKVVMSDITGRNIATDTTSGSVFTVLRTPTPDLVVGDIEFINSGNLIPGDKLQLNYNVTNQGTGETGEGWKENIYLENSSGTRSFIGSKTYENTLIEGITLPRVVELDIPQVVKVDGDVKAYVEIVNLKATGELIADQGNNSGTSAASKMMEKRLFLSADRVEIEEGMSYRATLTRSGDWSMEETFDIAEYNDNGVSMLSLPASVTIPQGKSAVKFYIVVPDNSEVNSFYRTNMRVMGDDYDDVTMVVDVKDNDKKTLTLTTDKTTCTEGEDITLTVGIAEALTEDLRINISNTQTLRFSPSVRVITIPAGSLTASAVTTVTDNGTADPDVSAEFTASCNDYTTVKRSVWIADNDRPNLTIALTPDLVSEDDGYYASTARITRDGDLSAGMSVFVTSTSDEVYFDSNKNRIPEGASYIEIPVSVKDNSMKEGERTAVITTALILSDNKTIVGADSPSYSQATLTITDNETDNILTLACGVAQLVEGGSGANVTLKRNSTQGDVTVSLICDDAQVDMPESVTIPDGSSQVTFVVKAKSNYITGDGHYVVVKAAASNYQASSFTFYISDKSMADALLAEPVTVNPQVFCGQTVPVAVKVDNRGTATLPAGFNLEIILMEEKYYVNTIYHTTPTQTLLNSTTKEEIAPGESKTFTYDVKVPENGLIGQYYLFAWINRDLKQDELSKSKDNYCLSAPLFIRPAFSTQTISADKTDYFEGDVMTITGQMTNSTSGLDMEGREVEVYAIDAAGNRFTKNATLDADGQFTAAFEVNSNYGGKLKLGACCKGVNLADEQATANVWKLSLKADYANLVVTETVEKSGEVTVTNVSAKTLKNIRLIHDGLPEGWIVTSSTQDKLQAGAATILTYSITPTTSTDKKVKDFVLKAVGTTDDGSTVTGSKAMKYYSYAAKCKLTADVDAIKTTLMRATQRILSFSVSNTGTDATGDITVETPSESPWLSVVSAATVPSINKGESFNVSLQLTHQSDMITDGTYQSFVRLKPADGTAIVVPITITVVGTDKATLSVDVVDVYTLEDEEGNGPHVKDATVTLTNALTREVALTGKTDDDGIWQTDMLKEGTYYVKVTAANHYYSEKTITIGPGENKSMEIFLPYKAVNVTYTVEETSVVDEYHTVVEMTFVPDIPQAIVVPDLPERWGCGSNVYAIKLTNKGRLTAYNPYFEFPNIEGHTFTVKSDYPEVLYPGESAYVTIEYVGPEDQVETGIGALVMNYGYKLQGEMYRSRETYAAVVGCKYSMPIFIGGGGLGSGSEKNYGGAEPELNIRDIEKDENANVSLPNVTYRDYTKTNNNSVTLQFEQKFFLTRQAFKGTLKVENAQMTDIQDIYVEAKVTNLEGENVTELFALEYKGVGAWEKKNETDTDKENGKWKLGGNATGEANVLYVPSMQVAPSESTDYLFGGTLTYRDVSTGNLVTVELMQTKLTVNPSPDIHLTYFLQRDFISDDPLTEEVEEWQPTQFAVLIQNKGNGPALDLKIETSEAQVVENLNNLPVKFTTLYTTIDGNPGTSSFKNLEVGRIEPGQNVLARWWFYSNVSGYLADYNVTMTKSSNYGEDFNLISIDGVKELKHSVMGTINSSSRMAPSKQRAAVINTNTNIFLLNEIEDENDMPDYVIDGDGNGTDDLEIVSDGMTVSATGNEGEFLLTVDASRSGWVYGEIHDPTNCTMVLDRVIRTSDGNDVTGNLWQTDRTMLRDNSLRYENLLHLADNITPGETYTLYYTAKPAPAPKVESIELKGNTTAMPNNAVKKAVVTFEETVDLESVDGGDIVVRCGNKVFNVTVTAEDGKTVNVEWDSSEMTSGDYSITVYTSGIKNLEGLSGQTSKSAEWTQRILNAQTYKRGDSNGDGKVDGLDVIMTTAGIVDRNLPGLIFDNADTNLDGKLDAIDVVETSNIVVGEAQDE